MSSDSPYEMMEELGRGAMGIVYKARDRNLDRFVAIKSLKRELSADETLVKRFKREAAMAARLNHPNIVTLYGVEFAEDTYRLVMEYVEGQSLYALVKKTGRQETKYSIELICQAAKALEEAHDKNLIHRDVKLQNILLSSKGQIKVTDFGLAKAFREESDLTTDTARLGTPRYMSPEQIGAAPLTPHTDIYSLGVVLYELLAGEPAFKEADPIALMHRIVEGPFPDIRRINSRITADVAKIIAKMTARSPLDRYPSATRLKNDLTSWLERGVAPVAGAVELQHEDSPVHGVRTGVAASMLVRGDETDFIIHFVPSDKSWAEWIGTHLKESGYSTELRPWDFKQSQNELRYLRRAVEKSSCVLSIVSPSYLKALHGERAWSHAFLQGTLTAAPIMVTPCFLGATFRTPEYVDLCDLAPEEAKRVILDEAVELRGLPGGDAGAALDAMLKNLAPAKLTHTIWNVPVEPAEHFAGRAQALTTMQTNFSEAGGFCALVQERKRDVGLGLSQLAAEYAHLHKSSYSLVWWINAQRQSTLLLGYTQLAEAIGLPEKDSAKASVKAKAVKHWLANNRGWLLIFDGARSVDYVSTMLPRRMTGHVLFTSSNAKWPKKTNPVMVGTLAREESVQYIYNFTQQRNEGAAAALASCLGDVPLALTLAAANVKGSQSTVDAYIDRFLERHRGLWGVRGAVKSSAAVVTTAASLSVEQVRAESVGALSLLKACAYFSSRDIPVMRMSLEAKLFPRSLGRALQNTKQLDEALGVLKRYGLVEERDGRLSLHHTIQSLVREWTEADPVEVENEAKSGLVAGLEDRGFGRKNRKLWAESALKFMEQSTPVEPVTEESRREFESSLQHVTLILKHTDRLEVAEEMQSELWRRMGAYQAGILDYDRAIQAYLRAIELMVKVRGRFHENVSRLYKLLAHVHRAQGDLKQAQANYDSALGIDRKVFGASCVEVSADFFNLGSVCLQLGDHAQARKYYSDALEMNLKVQGKFTSDTGRDYTYMGLVSQELGDLTTAWEHYGQALEICESVFEENHERVSAAVKNLAGLMQKMGDLTNAKELYKRSITIDTGLHGEHHPDVAQDYNNLGIVEEALGMNNGATEHYKKALEINRAVYGSKHIKVGINKNNVGNMLRVGGDLKEAARYYSDAIRIFDGSLGKHHEHTETAKRNLRRVRAEAKTGKTKKPEES